MGNIPTDRANRDVLMIEKVLIREAAAPYVSILAPLYAATSRLNVKNMSGVMSNQETLTLNHLPSNVSNPLNLDGHISRAEACNAQRHECQTIRQSVPVLTVDNCMERKLDVMPIQVQGGLTREDDAYADVIAQLKRKLDIQADLFALGVYDLGEAIYAALREALNVNTPLKPTGFFNNINAKNVLFGTGNVLANATDAEALKEVIDQINTVMTLSSRNVANSSIVVFMPQKVITMLRNKYITDSGVSYWEDIRSDWEARGIRIVITTLDVPNTAFDAEPNLRAMNTIYMVDTSHTTLVTAAATSAMNNATLVGSQCNVEHWTLRSPLHSILSDSADIDVPAEPILIGTKTHYIYKIRVNEPS